MIYNKITKRYQSNFAKLLPEKRKDYWVILQVTKLKKYYNSLLISKKVSTALNYFRNRLSWFITFLF